MGYLHSIVTEIVCQQYGVYNHSVYREWVFHLFKCPFYGDHFRWVRMQGTRELGTRRELDGCCGESGGYVAEYNRQRRFITLLIQEKDGKQSEEGQGCVFCGLVTLKWEKLGLQVD